MPGYDRTGPAGYGPMTGGRRGLCTGGYSFRRGPFGYGMGRGRRCFGYPASPVKEELEMHQELLKRELEAVENQIQDLSSTKEDTTK